MLGFTTNLQVRSCLKNRVRHIEMEASFRTDVRVSEAFTSVAGCTRVESAITPSMPRTSVLALI